MLDDAAELISTFGPFVIATMGVTVSVIPNIARRAERWMWVAAFVAVGAGVSTATYYGAHSSSIIQRKIYEYTTGGAGYIYVTLTKSIPGSDKMYYVLVNPGSAPVFDVDVHFFAATEGPNHSREGIDIVRDIVRPGETILNTGTEREGKYAGLITTRGTQVVEMIMIKSSPGVQPTRDVYVYSSTNDWRGGSTDAKLLLHESNIVDVH